MACALPGLPEIFKESGYPLTSSDLTDSEPTTDGTKDAGQDTGNDAAREETAQGPAEAGPNPCEREVSVEVPAEEVARAWKTVLARFQKHARIPGFRNGKVPPSLIRAKFAGEIRSEVLEHLVPHAFREETKKQNLIPVGQPRMVELDLQEDQPLRFKAVFEILPPFEVPGYQEIKVPHEPVTVGDEDIDRAVAALREQQATYINVDEERGLADGDFASVAFTSTSTEEGAQPVEMKDVMVEIGGVNTLAAFGNNLRGARAGETRSFDVTYPEDFGDQRLAGKTLHYEIEVKGIKTKSAPELNDEWVKEMGQEGMSTLDELRIRIREGMEHEKKHQAEHRVKEELLRKLTEKFPVDVPKLLVENAVDQRLERGLRSLMGQGLRAEDIKRMDLGKLREGQREGALRDVRANLLLEKIADLEGIQVSEEEIDREIAAAAHQSRQDPLAMRKQLEQNNGLDGVRSQLRCDRALEWLYQHSG
jgi:trigger factor